jgi:hypothetical protein
MQILWTNHPSDKSLNGTKQHVAREFAIVVASYNQATICPRPNYGTKEWIEERQAADAARGINKADTAIPFVVGVRWGLQEHSTAGTVIVRETAHEIAYYGDAATAAHYGCPKSLVAEFNSRTDNRAAQNQENAKIAQKNTWAAPVKFV